LSLRRPILIAITGNWHRKTDGMEFPTVTVVVTTYNYGRFIEQAIDSVLAQEYPQEKIQIVVVDDGSTDDTAERVRKYGSRIDYFRKPNGGQASALNLGLARARGEIVALLDADDMFLPRKLACAVDAFQGNDSLGMVYHPQLEWNIETNEVIASKPALFSGDLRSNPEQVLSYFILPASCVSFRRESLAPLQPIPENIRMLADAYLITLLPLISPVLAISEPLTQYRIHGSNSYYVDEQRASLPAQNARRRQALVLTDAMLNWVTNQKDKVNLRHVQLFRSRWGFESQGLLFKIRPPGRWRTFLFLLRKNYVYSSIQTWKFTVFNYVTCGLALVLGYGKAQFWQNEMLSRAEKWFSKFSNTKMTGGH
jgi:glycosyltransferase involved in cell wall biosynthesis